MTPNYDIYQSVSAGKKSRTICGRCTNVEAAADDGLERFEHLRFEPVQVTDCEGQRHEFHFRTRLFGTGVALDAFEVRDGIPSGYKFQVIGEPEGDQMVLLGRLIDKIRSALALKHLEQGQYGPQIAEHRTVRARIDSDPDEYGVPLLVIDGREITWEEFGRMLMTYEGWEFKLEIRDKSASL
jgi:hypothetical protein